MTEYCLDLRNYNAHFNWHPHLCLPKSKAALIVKAMEENSNQASPKTKDYLLKYYPNQVISKTLSQIYFYILLGQLEKAENLIQEITRIIKQVDQNKEGFLIVINGLQVYILWLEKRENPDKMLENLLIEMRGMKITPFDELSPNANAKVGILAAKYYFLTFFTKELRIEDQIEILKELQNLDSKNVKWYYLMHRLLRDKRRGKRGRRTLRDENKEEAPSEEEKAELFAALKLIYGKPVLDNYSYFKDHDHNSPIIPNSHPHPTVLCKLIYIVDMIKTNYDQQLIQIDDNFVNEETAVEFISYEAWNLVKYFKNDYFFNLEIANIFLVLLPRKYRRQDELVKKCLEKCLDLGSYPNSYASNSHLYHKYGLLHLNTRYRDTKKAEEWFSKSLECDPHNFPALMDLIQVKVGNLESREDADNLLNIFEREILNFEDEPWRQPNLLFIKGVFHFIINEDLEAIDSWNEVLKLDKTYLEFRKFHYYFIPKYGWEGERLNLSHILNVVYYETLREFPGNYDELLKEIDWIKRLEVLEDEERAKRRGEIW